MSIHIAAVRIGGDLIETACGLSLRESDGLHAWAHGGLEFWGVPLDEVDCQNCLRTRTRDRYFTSIRRPDRH